MVNFLNEVTNLIQSTSEAVKSVGESADKVITTSLRGRFVHRDGETNEAYQARLQFLKEQHLLRANQKLEKQKIKEERRKHKVEQKLELQKLKLERQKLRRNSKEK